MSHASEIYQKTADTLRQAAHEKLGPRDPAHDLLNLAANQLENAADSARLLERILFDQRDSITMIEPKPSNHGQWEGERIAEARTTYRQGMVAGALLMAVAWLLIEVLA